MEPFEDEPNDQELFKFLEEQKNLEEARVAQMLKNGPTTPLDEKFAHDDDSYGMGEVKPQTTKKPRRPPVRQECSKVLASSVNL